VRSILAVVLGVSMFQTAVTGKANAQDGAAYVVTYVEVMPQSAEEAIVTLKADAAASLNDNGCRGLWLLLTGTYNCQFPGSE